MAGKRSRAIRRTSSVSVITSDDAANRIPANANSEGLKLHQGCLEAVYVDSGCCKENSCSYDFRINNSTGVIEAKTTRELFSSPQGQRGGPHHGASPWVDNAIAEHKRHSSNGRNVRQNDRGFLEQGSGQQHWGGQDGNGLNLLAALKIEETAQSNGELSGLPPLPTFFLHSVTNTATPASSASGHYPLHQPVYASRQMQSTVVNHTTSQPSSDCSPHGSVQRDFNGCSWQAPRSAVGGRKERKGEADLLCQTSPWGYGITGMFDGDEQLECDWWEPPRESLAGVDGQGFGYFLDSCGYCLKALNKDHDIYMYGGDRAFCSEECRQQQIHIDERPQRQCSKSALRMDLTRRNGQPVVQRRVMVGSAA